MMKQIGMCVIGISILGSATAACWASEPNIPRWLGTTLVLLIAGMIWTDLV